MRITPGHGSEMGGSQIRDSNTLEKRIVHARIHNNFTEPMEVEGENHYERRTQFEVWVVWFLFSKTRILKTDSLKNKQSKEPFAAMELVFKDFAVRLKLHYFRNYVLHLLTLGHYKYDPYEGKSVAPGSAIHTLRKWAMKLLWITSRCIGSWFFVIDTVETIFTII